MVLITRKISFNRFGIGDWFWSHPCPCPSCFWFSQGDASNCISSWHCQRTNKCNITIPGQKFLGNPKIEDIEERP